MPNQNQNITSTSTPDKILEVFRPRSVNEDIPASEVDPGEWTDCDGFYMRPGYAVRNQGLAPIFGTVLFRPVNLINVFEGAQNFWVYMGEDGIGVVDQDNVHSDITPAVYTQVVDPSQANQTIINGFPIQSFQQDPPTFWDKQTGNVCQPLPDWPANTIAKSIRSFKFFLFAMNITESAVDLPDALIWSDSAPQGQIPQEWTPTPTNQAGSTELAATAGGIIDGLALRGSMIFYKNHSTYTCNFTGGTFVFAFRKLFSTSGILANNCVAEAEGVHYVLTDGDFIAHDGQNIRSLVDQKLRVFIFEQIDPVNFVNSFVFNYAAAKEVWACFPSLGQTYPDVAVVYNYANQHLSVRPLQGTFSHAKSGLVLQATQALDWDSQVGNWNDADGSWSRSQFTAAFERAAAAVAHDNADDKTQILQIDEGNTARDGIAAVGGQISRESLDMGVPESFKYVRRLWPRVTGTTGTVIQIRVGVQQDPSDGIAWSPFQDFRINVDSFLNFDQSGRYISVRFQEDSSPTADPQNVWGVHGFDLEYRLQGTFADDPDAPFNV